MRTVFPFILVSLNVAVLAFETGKVSFSIQVKNEIIRYREMALFVMPGEKLQFQSHLNDRSFLFLDLAKDQSREVRNTWDWIAPLEKGHVDLNIVESEKSDTMLIHIFVMVNLSEKKGEWLNGYRIGPVSYTHLRAHET